MLDKTADDIKDSASDGVNDDRVEVGGTYMVRRGEGSWCQAEIIQKRLNDAGTEN